MKLGPHARAWWWYLAVVAPALVYIIAAGGDASRLPWPIAVWTIIGSLIGVRMFWRLLRDEWAAMRDEFRR